jgi:hypothetical protein
MADPRSENFLSTPPCPFRRVSFGTAHCTISTDNHVSEVDPLTCHNCEVPGILAQPRCRFLSLGTELKPYRGEGKLVTSMACRALNIKLYSLKTCDECPLYSEVGNLADTIRQQRESAEVQLIVREDLVEEIARDIKLEYGVRMDEAPPLLPIRCWRFPEGRCRKLPVYTPGKVTVILKHSDRNNEIYRTAVLPAIKAMNLQTYRLDEELATDEESCRACENIQESDFTVLSLDDWSANSVFLAGIVHGLGRSLALLKNTSLQAVPLLELMHHNVVRYEQIGDLKQKLIDHFTLYVKPERDG